MPLSSPWLIVPVALLVYGLTLLILELRHRLRPASPLQLVPGPFAVNPQPQGLQVEGTITISNPHRRMEVFVPELAIDTTLLGQTDLDGVTVRSRITAVHPDAEARADGYWAAYIVKGLKSTQARIQVTVETGERDPRTLLDTLWLDINWVNYGPFGRLWRRDGVLIPLIEPTAVDNGQADWRAGDSCRVLPLKTHLLGVLDNPLEVLKTYGGQHLQRGDVLTIGARQWRIVTGRGHAPEHSCLVSDGVMISGDQVLPRITSNVSVRLDGLAGQGVGVVSDLFLIGAGVCFIHITRSLRWSKS